MPVYEGFKFDNAAQGRFEARHPRNQMQQNDRVSGFFFIGESR